MKKVLLGIFIIVFALSLFSCGGDDDYWDSNFYVNNYSANTLDIWLDGLYYFTLVPGTSNTIESVPPGSHMFEAFLSPGGPLYAWQEVDNPFEEDYHWNIY